MKDPIFLNSQRYKDKINYERTMIAPPSATERAETVREAICDLVIQRKLDALDLQIIEERDCSPMPTMRDVALRTGVGVGTIHRRVKRIKALITKNIPA